MGHHAELLADRGAAAVEAGHFFRSEAFFAAEGVTHTLLVREGGTVSRLALPLCVRDIPCGGDDAISPYGYPGGTLTGPAIDPARVDFSGTGLVSVFVRDRVAAPVLAGGTARNRILLHDPARPRALRAEFRTQPRRNARRGFTNEVIAGPDADRTLRDGFARVYAQTMRRLAAAPGYFFDDGYLAACLDTPSSRLVVVRDPEGGVAAAAIVVLSDGMLHYFLSGTEDAHLASSPSKNAITCVLDLADEWGIPVNFGGGTHPGDGLEQFKAGFTNAEEHLVTHEIVGDAARYAELVRRHGGPATEFFPAYRG